MYCILFIFVTLGCSETAPHSKVDSHPDDAKGQRLLNQEEVNTRATENIIRGEMQIKKRAEPIKNQ